MHVSVHWSGGAVCWYRRDDNRTTVQVDDNLKVRNNSLSCSWRYYVCCSTCRWGPCMQSVKDDPCVSVEVASLDLSTSLTCFCATNSLLHALSCGSRKLTTTVLSFAKKKKNYYCTIRISHLKVAICMVAILACVRTWSIVALEWIKWFRDMDRSTPSVARHSGTSRPSRSASSINFAFPSLKFHSTYCVLILSPFPIWKLPT
jgi:hypothetical protein